MRPQRASKTAKSWYPRCDEGPERQIATSVVLEQAPRGAAA
jgi:hypothetical protein